MKGISDIKSPLGRVALVTGAGRGIGRAIALDLAREGAAVVVNYRRDEAAARATVKEIEELGARAAAVQASVGDRADVDRLADEALAAFGQVDILVSNAGGASSGRPIAETPDEEFERLLQTHAFGATRLVRSLLPHMRERSRSHVVVISSSEVTSMRAGGGPYNMAKAALEAMAMTLAKEESIHGVRVNVVAPGLVVTDMGSRLVKAKLGVDDMTQLDSSQPLGRLCRPDDIASVVSFLCSERASHVVGQRIVVNGGWDASPTAAT